MSSSNSEDNDDYIVAAQMMICANVVVMEGVSRKKDAPMKIDHRTALREPKRKWSWSCCL
jgi:hypothetical protein